MKVDEKIKKLDVGCNAEQVQEGITSSDFENAILVVPALGQEVAFSDGTRDNAVSIPRTQKKERESVGMEL